jgi:hypothetical protein
MGSAQRAPGREHIPEYPRGFIVLRALQLVLTIIVLGITAYTMAVVSFVSNSLMTFTCVVSLIVTAWLVSAHSCAPQAYNYWATLVFDIFLLLLWLVSWILMASSSAWLFVTDGDFCTYNTCYSGLSDEGVAFASVLAGAAGLGAINCLLFFISLIIHSVVVCRHRRKGLHNKKVHGGVANAGFALAPQGPATYAAVPQQGMPFNQQDTAYNPNQMYNPPPPAAMYPPQQTGTSSPGGYYQAPQSYYPPPQANPPSQASQPHLAADPYAKSMSPTVTSTVYEAPAHPASPYQPPAYHPPAQHQ